MYVTQLVYTLQNKVIELLSFRSYNKMEKRLQKKAIIGCLLHLIEPTSLPASSQKVIFHFYIKYFLVIL